ncbi:MAG: hypothetical protein ACKO5M_04425 [Vulcanococcus sp.]
MNSAERPPAPGLVLLAPGGLADPAAATRLAALLGLRRLAATGEDPQQQLAALADEPPGWVLPLPLDPGQELMTGGCWAELLGAWRQPALLLIPGWAPAGAPRAYRALLQVAGVPLVGLVQLGGTWDPALRRRDGLPWLGWLPDAQPDQPGSASATAGDTTSDAGNDAAVELLAACRMRWREVSAARTAPPPLHPPGAGGPPA